MVAVSGVRDGRRLIVVVMGAPSGSSRDVTAESLRTSGFEALARESGDGRTSLAQAQPAQVAEGDADDDEPPAEAETANRPIERPARWTVQVGASRARLQAQRYLTAVARRYERQLRGVRGRVVGRSHGPFRVQFTSLGEQ